MKPLILITNDDGYQSAGIKALIGVARQFGDVVVTAPASNASGQAHSFTASRPLRVHTITKEEGLTVFSCDGTPVDCVKLSVDHLCERTPDLVLSGINHGSNSSINVLYSGTMGAVIEASVSGLNAVGFSLLDFRYNADFGPAIPFVADIVSKVLRNGLPSYVALNVNIPVPDDGVIKGIKVCRQSYARWLDSYERRVDPHGKPYYWLAGRFECDDDGEGTDQWALQNGYVSVVPTLTDYTAHSHIDNMRRLYE